MEYDDRVIILKRIPWAASGFSADILSNHGRARASDATKPPPYN